MTFARNKAESTERAAEREAQKARNRSVLVSAPNQRVGRYDGEVRPLAAQPKLTREQKVRHDIRASAKGELCTVRLLGVCNGDPATTVWSHYPLNDGGKGMATKSLDLLGCYCCSACHDVVDRRVPTPSYLSAQGVLLDWFKGHARSMVRLAERGML